MLTYKGETKDYEMDGDDLILIVEPYVINQPIIVFNDAIARLKENKFERACSVVLGEAPSKYRYFIDSTSPKDIDLDEGDIQDYITTHEGQIIEP